MKPTDSTHLGTMVIRIATFALFIAFAGNSAASVLSAEQRREADATIERHRKGVLVIEDLTGGTTAT